MWRHGDAVGYNEHGEPEPIVEDVPEESAESVYSIAAELFKRIDLWEQSAKTENAEKVRRWARRYKMGAVGKLTMRELARRCGCSPETINAACIAFEEAFPAVGVRRYQKTAEARQKLVEGQRKAWTKRARNVVKPDVSAKVKKAADAVGVATLAAEVGVDRSTIRRWRNGEAAPRPREAANLQRALAAAHSDTSVKSCTRRPVKS
jgi:transcriptional regulator with XRE-family HTH domain